MPTLDDALSLAAHGWEVLPLAGKIPTTQHGVKDATTDPGCIAELWGDPRAARNIGARVPAALVVLDFDPQNGGTPARLEQLARVALPPTLIVHSGRGTGGHHRYYRHPGGQLTTSRLRKLDCPGVDIKTSTGYCVMPPSIHPATGDPYRWELREPVAMPPKLLELLRPLPPRVMPPARDGRPHSARGLVDAVRAAPEGDRNARLYWAACRALAEAQPPEVLAELAAAAIAAGLPEAEARAALASARRRTGGA